MTYWMSAEELRGLAEDARVRAWGLAPERKAACLKAAEYFDEQADAREAEEVEMSGD